LAPLARGEIRSTVASREGPIGDDVKQSLKRCGVRVGTQHREAEATFTQHKRFIETVPIGQGAVDAGRLQFSIRDSGLDDGETRHPCGVDEVGIIYCIRVESDRLHGSRAV